MAKKAGRKSNTPVELAREVMSEVRRQLLTSDWERSRARWLSGKRTGDAPQTAQYQKPSPRKTPQADRVKQAIQKLWPDGVPDEIATESIRGRVSKYLASENKKLGLRLPDPSWPTIKRALHTLSGRSK